MMDTEVKVWIKPVFSHMPQRTVAIGDPVNPLGRVRTGGATPNATDDQPHFGSRPDQMANEVIGCVSHQFMITIDHFIIGAIERLSVPQKIETDLPSDLAVMGFQHSQTVAERRP
jgi:hypothetical protein